MRTAIQGLVVALALIATGIAAGQVTSEEHALLQFQRAADTYAFQHRRVERHVGGTPSQGAMASAIKTERTVSGEGVLFTPLVAAALRNRIQVALGRTGCAGPDTNSSFIVPRPTDAAAGTIGLSACLVAALPKLPPELEYRSAGVVLVLVDVHAGLVVDVVHGAFPVRND